MQIEPYKTVEIIYQVKDVSTNQVIDQNDTSNPLKFIFGTGQVIKGLEEALRDKKKGEKINVTVLPKDAYGDYDPEMIQDIPIEQLQGIDLKNGMTLFGQGDNGQSVQAIVQSFTDSLVKIDFNHKLAGKTLLFEVEVLDVYNTDENKIFSPEDFDDDCGCSNHGGCGCH